MKGLVWIEITKHKWSRHSMRVYANKLKSEIVYIQIKPTRGRKQVLYIQREIYGPKEAQVTSARRWAFQILDRINDNTYKVFYEIPAI